MLIDWLVNEKLKFTLLSPGRGNLAKALTLKKISCAEKMNFLFLESEITDQEEIAENDQLIDDLFEGVTTINSDDDLIEPPFMRELENAGKPTLTRQKSRQEIRSELTVVRNFLQK